MMLLNDHVAGTSSTLTSTVQSVDRRTSSSSPLNRVPLTAIPLTAVGQRKQSKWTRHRDGEWSLRPGIIGYLHAVCHGTDASFEKVKK